MPRVARLFEAYLTAERSARSLAERPEADRVRLSHETDEAFALVASLEDEITATRGGHTTDVALKLALAVKMARAESRDGTLDRNMQLVASALEDARALAFAAMQAVPAAPLVKLAT